MFKEITPPEGVTKEKWNDWQWQVKNSITTVQKLAEYIDVDDDLRKEIEKTESDYRWKITPYFAHLMDDEDIDDSLFLQAVPSERELHDSVGVIDPLDEEKHSPAPGIIKVYPDRIAWCVSNNCAVLCRHCLRKRFMTAGEEGDFSREGRQQALEYIRQNEEIRDVLLTGGDPLLYPDSWVEEILAQLTEIEHVEIVRIGSRVPSTLPQRITPELCDMLKKYHPLWLNTQFNHPGELTEQAREACAMLAEAGIPLGNQSVLMKGINDDPQVMKDLVQGLVAMRVRPYYIYQCQILEGTEHFRTPVEDGINIIYNLRGYTTGFAVPTYVLDTPVGKVPMNPEYVKERDEDSVLFSNFRGAEWREPNPAPGKEKEYEIDNWRFPFNG
ncbi:MAG: KamA family radical SAM protein [Halanaerobiaceae bacterium]